MTNWIKALCLIAGVGAIGACGDDGDGGGGGSSGVSSSKKASELSADEATKVCEYVNGLAPTVDVEQQCTIGAALETSSKAECEAVIDPCVDQLSMMQEEEEEGDDCADAADDIQGCDATVKQIEDCFKAYASALEDSLNGLTCDDAGMVEESDLDVGLPSACSALESACPQLLSDDGGDSGDSSDASDDASGIEEEDTVDGSATGSGAINARGISLSALRQRF